MSYVLGELPTRTANAKLLLLVFIVCCSSSATCIQYAALETGSCPAPSAVSTSSIIDITHALRPDLPGWEIEEGFVGTLVELVSSIANDSLVNISFLKFSAHTGTHVDAPSHVFQEYYDAEDHVDTLDLNVLNGLALLVDVPRDTNLTAEAMQALNIPYGVERVIFRTLNTDRRLMWKRFDTSYVGFTTEGALWLRENTKIKLIGIDYLSVAAYDSLLPAHLVFLQNKDIVLVEGLNLDNVDVGLYELHCLPLLLKADGSPIRCILQK